MAEAPPAPLVQSSPLPTACPAQAAQARTFRRTPCPPGKLVPGTPTLGSAPANAAPVAGGEVRHPTTHLLV